jgi:hypothetical protein
MKDEIREGVEFLRQFLTKYGNGLSAAQIDSFAAKLAGMLEERYVNHWYAEHPMKGQAFRCLRLKRSENYIDPVLERLLKDTGLSLNQLGLPNDFTLWIDPGEVSVRFGDQVGYTYPIAKWTGPPKLTAISEATDAGSGTSSASSSSSKLIAQSSEKIFDEKLTAFIRQNSTTTSTSQPSSTIAPTFDVVGGDDASSILMTDDLLDKLTNNSSNPGSTLSPEKRTISPPCGVTGGGCSASKQAASQQQLKRKNSSNITINNGNNRTTQNPIGSGAFAPSHMNNNELLANHMNRLSFNDSCYYSSSSSCASSFGSSNYEDNLTSANLGWFKTAAENPAMKASQLSDLAMASSINEIPNAAFLLSSMELGNTDALNAHHDKKGSSGLNSSTSSGLLPNPFGMASATANNFGGINNSNNNNGSFSVLSDLTFNMPLGQLNSNGSLSTNFNGLPSNNNMNSDTSSDRSDTPNSCITSSSVSSHNLVLNKKLFVEICAGYIFYQVI